MGQQKGANHHGLSWPFFPNEGQAFRDQAGLSRAKQDQAKIMSQRREKRREEEEEAPVRRGDGGGDGDEELEKRGAALPKRDKSGTMHVERTAAGATPASKNRDSCPDLRN